MNTMDCDSNNLSFVQIVAKNNLVYGLTSGGIVWYVNANADPGACWNHAYRVACQRYPGSGSDRDRGLSRGIRQTTMVSARKALDSCSFAQTPGLVWGLAGGVVTVEWFRALQSALSGNPISMVGNKVSPTLTHVASIATDNCSGSSASFGFWGTYDSGALAPGTLFGCLQP
jgi:hypothetical protein